VKRARNCTPSRIARRVSFKRQGWRSKDGDDLAAGRVCTLAAAGIVLGVDVL